MLNHKEKNMNSLIFDLILDNTNKVSFDIQPENNQVNLEVWQHDKSGRWKRTGQAALSSRRGNKLRQFLLSTTPGNF
jgi:hypothetical protein